MPVLQIKIDGAKELEKKLLSFEPKLARRIVRQTLRAAAKPILAAAKANVPVLTGALKESLKLRVMKKAKHRYGILVATAKGWFKGDTYYGAFVEFGTSKMAAKPFIRPAFDSEKENAERIIIDDLKQGIEQIGAEK